MLTADLVTARRRGTELRLVALDDTARRRVEELAQTYGEIARAHVGQRRDQLEAAWDAVPAAAQEQRLAAGVRKLVSDRCVFNITSGGDPAGLRRQLFLAAFAARRTVPVGIPFDRELVVQQVAAVHGFTPADLERQLYADLHGAELLCEVGPISAPRLAADFDLAQAQGILLRAVRVVAEVRASDPAALRALFRKLKFLRLLHTIAPLAPTAKVRGGYRIEIDGPFSLFQSVTRYGLALAMALPAITATDVWRVEAQVLWGQQRQPVRFVWTGESASPAVSDTTGLPDDVATLIRDVNQLQGAWRAEIAAEVLDLPGIGLCVPDLVFAHAETGQRVFLEVLGFWSREAVWRRVDLVRAGLPHRILFAVSKQLRVSEEALGGDDPAALYVYSRVMSAKIVLQRVAELAARSP